MSVPESLTVLAVAGLLLARHQSPGRSFEASAGRNSAQASGSTVHIEFDTRHSPSILTRSNTSTPQWLVLPSFQN